jgi:hypothetical protein
MTYRPGMSKNQRLDDLARRVSRLEWESRHSLPCHCGHTSREHWGASLHSDFGTSCMCCPCRAYSPPTEEEA